MTTANESSRPKHRLRLRAARRKRGWGQDRAASEIYQLGIRLGYPAEELGVDVRAVSRWERGVVEPKTRYVRIMCSLYGLPADQLDLAPPVPDADDGQQPSASTDAVLVRPAAGPKDQEGERPAERRTLVFGLFGMATTISTSVALTDPAARSIERLTRACAGLSAEVLDALDGLLDQLGDQYSRTPPTYTYARLEALLQSIWQLLPTAPPKHRTRMWSIAGWLTAMLANSLYDLGDSVASEAAALAAAEYAVRSRDDRLLAFVHDRQAMRAENSGLYSTALERFQTSIAHAPSGTAVRVRALAASARIHSRLGDHSAASRSLAQAESEYGRLPPDQVGDGSLSVSSLVVTDAVSSTHELRGDTASAVDALQQTIDYYTQLPLSARRPTRLALAHLRMAHMQAGSTQPDHAVAHAMTALSTERLVTPVLLQADRLSSSLTRRWPSEPSVRQLREKVHTLVSQRPVA